ncbi:MAG: molecular chaperone TorD family protein [Acidobacteriia bacterium]|nr:molecular chaperone TorD family protein [Terriglobia bacterium]
MQEMKSMASAGAMQNSAGMLPSTNTMAGESKRGRTARSRAMVYSILAQALSSPSEALCLAVREGALSALLGVALEDAPPAHRRMIEAGLLESFTAISGDESFAGAILAEYTRLFSSNLHCMQYEADYLGRNAENSVHVIAAIASMYSTFGVRLADTVGERPDHIAVELDFMNFLAAKEAYASDRNQVANAGLCRRAQVYFLSKHLARWGRMFAGNLAQATIASFYRSICELLDRFLAAETRYFKIEISPVMPQETNASEKCGCNHCSGTNAEQPKELVQLTGLVQEMMSRSD